MLLSPVGSALVGAIVATIVVIGFWSATGSRRRAALEVRTVSLTQLAPDAAISLATPYIVAEGGALYKAAGVSAITIRERHQQIEEIVRLLQTYDARKPPVLLYLQLVRLGDTIGVAPGLGAVDSLLRSVIPHGGARTVGDAVFTGTVGQDLVQTMGSGTTALVVRVHVIDTPTDAHGLARLRVSGQAASSAVPAFDSEIAVALGNTTVLGSASLAEQGHPLVLSLKVSAAGDTSSEVRRR